MLTKHADGSGSSGLDPKQSMGIGLTALEKRIIEETDWHENLEGVLVVADVVKVIPDYMGIPIVIVKLHPEKFASTQEPYIGISTVDKTTFVETPEIAEHDAKIDIENHYSTFCPFLILISDVFIEILFSYFFTNYINPI